MYTISLLLQSEDAALDSTNTKNPRAQPRTAAAAPRHIQLSTVDFFRMESLSFDRFYRYDDLTAILDGFAVDVP